MLSPLQLGAQHVEDVLSSVSEQTARLAAAVTNIGAALEQRATRDDVRAASQAQAGEVAALAKRLAALTEQWQMSGPSTLLSFDAGTVHPRSFAALALAKLESFSQFWTDLSVSHQRVSAMNQLQSQLYQPRRASGRAQDRRRRRG